MQKFIFSVRDIAADVYSNPFTSSNQQTATRDFAHACMDPASALSKNPEDFQLYQLGSFDDELGVLEGHQPKLVANATQFVKGV